MQSCAISSVVPIHLETRPIRWFGTRTKEPSYERQGSRSGQRGAHPHGAFLGGLSPLSATELGALAIRAAIERAGDLPTSEIDEVIMGNVVTAGEGQAPARQAAIGGGVPVDIPAVTVNKVCGSGLKAVMLASQAIKAGDGNLYRRGRHGKHEQRALPAAEGRAPATAWATAR